MAETDRKRRSVLAALGGASLVSGLPLLADEPRDHEEAAKPIPVAVLLGANATLIDFAGPYEILGAAAYSCAGFDVYSVASTRDPVLCDDARSRMGDGKPTSGPRILPDYTFEDAPQPRVVVIGAQLGDEERNVDWLRSIAPRADLIASVCTGAFLFAKTGLLDGKRATTNRMAYGMFERNFPKVNVVRDVRFVDDGKVATATGLTAGIDLAIHIVERFYGREAARATATYEEWSEPSRDRS